MKDKSIVSQSEFRARTVKVADDITAECNYNKQNVIVVWANIVTVIFIVLGVNGPLGLVIVIVDSISDQKLLYNTCNSFDKFLLD